MDHTHRMAVHRRKQRTIVYMKCGHVSSYWSPPAVGTCRACRAVCRASLVLSVVAMFVTLLTHALVMMIVSTPSRCPTTLSPAHPPNSHLGVRARNAQRSEPSTQWGRQCSA